MNKLSFLIIVMLTSSTVNAATLSGTVVGVYDGDTLTLLTANKKEIKVRLAQIDAPEEGQAFSGESKKTLSDLVYKKQVSVNVTDTDRYGRTVGQVSLGKIDINLNQVAKGMAWVYRKYSGKGSNPYYDAEAKPKAAKIGIWSQAATSPWEWRRGNRPTPVAPIAPTTPAKPNFIGNLPTNSGFTCGAKRYCKQMTSCDEARFYFTQCGQSQFDKDGDGIPCEQVCN